MQSDSLMKRLTALFLSVACYGSAGCLFGDPPASPTNYTIVSPVTETFQSALAVGATASFNFVVGSPDPLRITLASVTNSASGAALSSQTLKLQLGTRAGDTCTPTFTTTTAAALSPQYLQVASPGNYCVIVSDPGTLTTTVNFAVRIVHS